ncbi:MAG: bifunctional hydroxymethylpyrimidine kinase/phosphomethylpyrimidine kinase [Oscillospiraceae bacterium]|nr:bifunctional hydroxymethylpyrimidine kinase/phosphomethylpyrimidine kinase [Oscillospiraceae bacterium]
MTATAVLTIAGSDCSGGAGIQADLKTFSAHGMYGMSVITALTAQNTLGVTGVQDVSPDFVAAQIDAVFADIRPNAVKIGMVSNAEIVRVIAERLAFHNVANIVLDPVIVATSGSILLSEGAVDALVARLFPLATVVTPNIPEAEKLSGVSIATADDMVAAARKIAALTNGGVLVKGGHSSANADDLLFCGEAVWVRSERINNPNTHGTGCTLSSAIACGLASEQTLVDSVRAAKSYVSAALSAGLALGQGSGPLWHGVSG